MERLNWGVCTEQRWDSSPQTHQVLALIPTLTVQVEEAEHSPPCSESPAELQGAQQRTGTCWVLTGLGFGN